jgi:2-iminobutanoate/2-iminopropanoate deaminase
MAKRDQVYHLRNIEKAFGYSQAVKDGSTLFISGSLSMDDDGHPLAVGDMAGQLRNIYADIRKTLEAHGATFENIVKEVIYTIDMDALLESAPIRSEFYEDFELPATSWIGVPRLVHPEFLVEVEVTACLPHRAISY